MKREVERREAWERRLCILAAEESSEASQGNAEEKEKGCFGRREFAELSKFGRRPTVERSNPPGP